MRPGKPGALWLPIRLVFPLGLLSSLLAVAYVWRVIEVAYFEAPPEGAERKEAPLSMLVPMWVAALASIWFGVSTEATAGVARKAAEMLLEVVS